MSKGAACQWYAFSTDRSGDSSRVDISVKEQRRRRALVIEAKWLEKKGKGTAWKKNALMR